MKTNLTVKYRTFMSYYIDGICRFKEITETKKVTDIIFYNNCVVCKNKQLRFTVFYDSIEQISDSKTLIKFNNNEYKYYHSFVQDLIKTLCNYSTEGGDK